MLDLDGTLVRLRVDWPFVRARLSLIASAHHMDLTDTRVLGMLQRAKEEGNDEALAEMEALLLEAELAAASACEQNRALVSWVRRLPPGLPVAILSSNRRETIERSLERIALNDRVGMRVGRNDVVATKPDPEGLSLIMSRLRVSPKQMLVIGDQETDLLCASKIGAVGRHIEQLGVDWEEIG